MDTERFKQIRKLFVEALERAPGERSAFLDKACQGDPVLRREVENLLNLDEETDGFLETPATTGLPPGWAGADHTGQRIGQYRLKRVISSGGMGTVYEAEQEHPKRTVAVKVMKQGIVSKAALRRFDYEAQILARLKHPNIAQVIEAGTHRFAGEETGSIPFFVMEFIPHARSLSDYVREKRLSKKERLSLFRQVCDAVHHGHQRGIIHRDLKPTNILVDANGSVKVIDFGVARTTDADMALTTIETEVGQLIGTLQYMSPEQCKADPHDLDIRSDVYTLGVVLYELLCGALPYDVRKAALFEATRLIREEPPKRPSTVDRTLRGDVETIVLKALEKERPQRYQTVADLGEDIQRYLNGEVILAHPTSVWIRAWKQVKRNPLLSSAVGAVVLCVVSFFLYVTLWSYPRIQEEKSKLEQEMGNTQMINSFLEEMLSWADPYKEGREVELIEMLDRAAERIDREFPDRPLIEASLRSTLGTTYMNNGRYDAAQSQLEKALELFVATCGDDHHDTLCARDKMAVLYWQKGQYDKAEPMLLETLAALRRVLGKDQIGTLSVQHHLGLVYSSQSRYTEAESQFVEALSGLRRTVAADHPDLLKVIASLTTLYRIQSRYDEAERLSLEVLQVRQRTLGENHPLTLRILDNLALLYWSQGHYDKAESLYLETLEKEQHALGEDHPDVLNTMTNLASLFKEQGRYDKAESLSLETLERRRRVLGHEHPLTLLTLHNLGELYCNQKEFEKAEPIYEEVLEAEMRILGKDHAQTIASMNGLANIYTHQGRFDEAEALYLEALEGNRRVFGEDHPTTQTAVHNLGVFYCAYGDFDKALPLFEQALEGKKSKLGNDHPDTLMAMHNLACLYYRQEKLDPATALFAETLEGRRRVLGDNHPATLETMNNLGGLNYFQGRYEEAESLLGEALEGRRRVLGDDHINTLSTLRSLAGTLKKQGKYEQAEPLARELLERTPGDSKDYEINKTILDQIREKLNSGEAAGIDGSGDTNE